MCDVAVSEDCIFRTDARLFAIACRTVNRDVFAKSVSVADFRARDSAFPFQILRLQPDARERKNFIFLSQLRVAVNNDMRMQFAFVAERDVFTNDTIRPNFAIVSDLCFGMNDAADEWMNHAIYAT